MAHSSHTKNSISIDLFNLPPLPDERRQISMFCEISNDFFLPDGKNSRLSQVVNTWTFGRLTPDGNEGVGVEIAYLESANSKNYFIVDQVNGYINVIHNDSIELTEFTGHFSPFNIDELQLKVCKLADHYKGENDPAQDIPAPQQNKFHPLHDSDTSSRQQNIEDLTDMGFNMPNHSPIPTMGNTAPQQPADVTSGTSIPKSTPRPQEGPRLNSLDLLIIEVRHK